MLVETITRNRKFCKKGESGQVHAMIWRHEVSNVNYNKIYQCRKYIYMIPDSFLMGD